MRRMDVRRQTAQHPLGTLKTWMGATHFLTRTLDKVRTELSLHILAYNLKRMITILGVGPLMAAMRADRRDQTAPASLVVSVLPSRPKLSAAAKALEAFSHLG